MTTAVALRREMPAKKDAGFPARLRELRLAAGISQAELGFRAGLHPGTIAQLEQEGAQPTWPTVRALADALGVTVQAFTEPPSAQLPPAGPGRPKKKRKK